MASPHALVVETMEPAGLERLRQACRVTYRPRAWRDPRLADLLRTADALVVRNHTRVDAGLLAAAPRLRVVGRLGAGLDNVDLKAAAAAGVTVVYAPDAATVSVAEHALALLLALARRIPAADRHVRAGGWRRQAFTGVELAGRTLGILGFGRIGREVARRARALGMEVIAWHPRLAHDDPVWRETGARPVAERELYAGAHALSIHLPLTPETRGLVDARRLGWLPRGALLVNTGRGEVVDEEALLRALRSGHLAGAALDVRRREPPPRPDPLASLPQVVLTPHVAAWTAEAQRRAALAVADDVLRVLAGLPPRHPAPAARRPTASWAGAAPGPDA